MAILTIVVERDRAKMPAFKYRAKIRGTDRQQFTGSLCGSVAEAKLQIENAFSRPLVWRDNEDPQADTRCMATVEVEIIEGAR